MGSEQLVKLYHIGMVPWALVFKACPKRHLFTVFLERNSGITGVPFGRTELLVGANGTDFYAILRRDGPVGPSLQGMPEMFDCHVFFKNVFLRVSWNVKVA